MRRAEMKAYRPRAERTLTVIYRSTWIDTRASPIAGSTACGPVGSVRHWRGVEERELGSVGRLEDRGPLVEVSAADGLAFSQRTRPKCPHPLVLRETQGVTGRSDLSRQRGLARSGQPTGENQPGLVHRPPTSRAAPRRRTRCRRASESGHRRARRPCSTGGRYDPLATRSAPTTSSVSLHAHRAIAEASSGNAIRPRTRTFKPTRRCPGTPVDGCMGAAFVAQL